MKKKWLIVMSFLSLSAILAGCERAIVFQPNGPVAKIQADTINFTALIMLVIVAIVCALFVFMLVKYRASKAPKDYEPPYMEGSKTLEVIWTLIPIAIVVVLSIVTVKTTYEVEGTPKGYEDQKPLVIYASSSNWKWHFSYPEEGIETVNYVNIPTDRVVEFRLYSFNTITSFWIPQLGGQKYAMSDMVTKLQFVADHPMSMEGKNANFNGKGFGQMHFEALSMKPNDYVEWVNDVKANEKELTEKEFNKLLETDFVGRKSYSSTHLEFSPPPEGENAGHDHGEEEQSNTSTDDKSDENTDHENH